MTLQKFYLYYLTQHQNKNCRTFHFIGMSLVLSAGLSALVYGRPEFLGLAPVLGFGMSQIGHFTFERNRPVFFKHPLYSLFSDFVMFKDILTGKIEAKLEEARKASF